MNRRELLVAGSALASGVWLRSCARVDRRFDVVLRGGTVYDGMGRPGVDADVAIEGDHIAAIGRIDAEQARHVIDVAGMCIAPGFVDIHSHSDRTILDCPTADSRVLQGYTTEITGNCGGSAAPGKVDVAAYFKSIESTKVSVNVALLIGQGTLRDNAIGPLDRALTDAEMESVLRSLEESLEQGALGLSTGLEYVPGIYTKPDEIERLARVVAKFGGLYASHMRNETSKLVDAVKETIDVGRKTGVRVEISHLKAAGKRNWPLQPEPLRLMQLARKEGIDVQADAYPYTAYGTGLTILVPSWSKDGGDDALLARLREPATRARILSETIATVDDDPGGYELIVISGVKTARNASLAGKSIAEIADLWQIAPGEAILRLIEEESTDVSYVGHAMSAENVELVLAHPLVMVGSDGVSRAMSVEGRPHPRSYGTAPRVLGHFCRERKVFDLSTAIMKLSSMPAERAGLKDRGRIEVGRKADLVVFDAARVKDRATFDAPQAAPEGIAHVLVNGVAVVKDAVHTGARPGRVLARG
jgi:N-acyl-D-aspartate/D-glutamate deacylase